MTVWRTDFENVPRADGLEGEFDVAMIDARGRRWRVTDCIINASRQICSYDPSWGYEPIEHRYSDLEFQRATHWMKVDLPDG